nr:AraC family transcriptional regulator [Paenibacillus phyllosphaerae]
MIRINICLESAHPSRWVESKQHQDYAFWHLHEGQIEIRVYDQVHIAREGDLILFSPKVAYTATNIGANCRFTFTHFNVDLGDQHRILDNFQLPGVISSSLVPEEAHLFLDSCEQYKSGAIMSTIRLKGALTILISKLLEYYELGIYRGGFTNNVSERKRITSFQKLQPVFQFIRDHLHQPIRIEKLAELAGMSEKYFIVYFKQASGVTPGLYIYQMKMNRARKLLYSKHYSVKQIAEMLGYPDPYTFSKAFKKYYNAPPSQFG